MVKEKVGAIGKSPLDCYKRQRNQSQFSTYQDYKHGKTKIYIAAILDAALPTKYIIGLGTTTKQTFDASLSHLSAVVSTKSKEHGSKFENGPLLDGKTYQVAQIAHVEKVYLFII